MAVDLVQLFGMNERRIRAGTTWDPLEPSHAEVREYKGKQRAKKVAVQAEADARRLARPVTGTDPDYRKGQQTWIDRANARYSLSAEEKRMCGPVRTLADMSPEERTAVLRDPTVVLTKRGAGDGEGA